MIFFFFFSFVNEVDRRYSGDQRTLSSSFYGGLPAVGDGRERWGVARRGRWR